MCVSNPAPLIIRADASRQIGTGHLMRGLALARGWQGIGGQVIFAVATELGDLQGRLQAEGMTVHRLSSDPGSIEDGEETVNLAKMLRSTRLVVDGYHFDARYQQQIKTAGFKLLVIDDCGDAGHYYADLVLNQNIYARESLYPHREPQTQLLLGSRYVLLRPEFLAWRDWQREIPEVARKILVTLGGSDPDNVTLKVIEALQQVKVRDLEVVAIVGASNPHYEQLQGVVQQSQLSISLKRNVMDMPELIAWADVAIAAGGSTNWELAFMGLPTLIIVLADNQKEIARELDKLGAAIDLGWHETLSTREIASRCGSLAIATTQRASLQQRTAKLIDGKGVERLLLRLEPNLLKLRTVRPDECQLLWQWANDFQVRQSSFSSDFISWNTHKKWFNDKLQSMNFFIFIGINGDREAIGQARFDIKDNRKAEIDISITSHKRGCGYGILLLKQALNKIFTETFVKTVVAIIKSENLASQKLFKKANFIRIETEHPDRQVWEFQKVRIYESK
ncbi:MAG: UDP-2,4-diacetamido-2,4,6-trideoxy-beta-L-altropyranose hydrolase [Cyanobacteria bacterium P01_E01_bin.42]